MDGLVAPVASRGWRCLGVLGAPVQLVLAYLGLFYGGCFFVYIVANPAVIVKCLFKAADAVPNYAFYAASQIFEQLQEEVKERIR